RGGQHPRRNQRLRAQTAVLRPRRPVGTAFGARRRPAPTAAALGGARLVQAGTLVPGCVGRRGSDGGDGLVYQPWGPEARLPRQNLDRLVRPPGGAGNIDGYVYT